MQSEIKDLAADLAGPGLDLLLDSKAAEAIPGLGSALKLAMATAAIPNLLFAKKVRGFILGSESISPEKRAEIIAILTTSPDRARLAGETIVDAIDRADSRQKAAIIGRLFAHYVLGDVDLEKLRRLMFAVDRGFLYDLLILPKWFINGSVPQGLDPRSLDGSGLVDSVLLNRASNSAGGPTYGITPLGQTFSQLLFGFDPS